MLLQTNPCIGLLKAQFPSFFARPMGGIVTNRVLHNFKQLAGVPKVEIAEASKNFKLLFFKHINIVYRKWGYSKQCPPPRSGGSGRPRSVPGCYTCLKCKNFSCFENMEFFVNIYTKKLKKHVYK